MNPTTDAATERTRLAEATTPAVRKEPLTFAFQPIVSIRTGRAFAVEALARKGPEFPRTYFESGHVDERRARNLDAAKIAITSYVEHAAGAVSLLALNWDARVGLDPESAGALATAAKDGGVGLIFEVSASAFERGSARGGIAGAARAAGALVALDDFGRSDVDLARLTRIGADIVKLDPALTLGVSTSLAASALCRGVIEHCRTLGALVVAEGIEEESDLVELAMLGVDLFQGHLVARPHAELDHVLRRASQAMDRCRPMLRTCSSRSLRARAQQKAEHEHVLVSLAARFAHATTESLNQVAGLLLDAHPVLEALYVLDHRGIQITDTFLRTSAPKPGFTPAAPGTDLGLKDYFLEVANGASAFASEPYVSMASGRRSVTYSRKVRIADGNHVVVCCDVPTELRRLQP